MLTCNTFMLFNMMSPILLYSPFKWAFDLPSLENEKQDTLMKRVGFIALIT